MKWKYKKVLVIMILLISILLNGCVSKKTFTNTIAEAYLTYMFDTLSFIENSNYKGEDISKLEYIKEDNTHSMKFIFKDDINVVELLFIF